MRLVLQLADRNFREGTGGPFAAAVFDLDTGELLSVGVNRVVPLSCSSAHAEVVCLSLAQRRMGSWNLGAGGARRQFVVNWLPCAMCFGATLWSGVSSLAIAGFGRELEELTGFDEGPVHPEWAAELAKRNIELVSGVCRDEAIATFKAFGASNALVYNGWH